MRLSTQNYLKFHLAKRFPRDGTSLDNPGRDVPLSLCPGTKKNLVPVSLSPGTRAGAKIPGQTETKSLPD